MSLARHAALPALTALALACPATATAGSLPSVGSGHRPGPDILYAPAPNAPQLRNAGPWRASPILVSGASAYRRGEFLYQDFLYDDHGALGIPDPTDPFNAAAFLFSPKKGTLTYPTAHSYANNAADLVELRIKPLARSTGLRVTLNSLADPERTAFTVAIGSSAAKVRWPHGAGVESRARLFLTVHGTHAELATASGEELGPAPTVSLSTTRRQFDVRIPHAAWNPRRAKVRFAAGVGLWDEVRDRYVAPGAVATADGPGGASTSGAALFNVAFRSDEPLPHIATPPIGNTIVEGGLGVRDDGAWWRERAQALALASGDISRFYARVDFAKLARRRSDDSGVPRTGFMDRIFASHFVQGQGVDHSHDCTVAAVGGPMCIPRFLGQLQTYAIYVPPRKVPRQGFGFTFLLHGLSANHNEFIGSRHARDFGERGAGSIVAAPHGRGPDGGWSGVAEGDAFEVWADVARHYKLDRGFNAVGGYSMGGVGTFRLAARWPDLFAAGVPVVGTTGGISADVPSLRNVPIMMWNVATDELVNLGLTELSRSDLAAAGVRFDSWLFPAGGHITLGNNDFYGPMTSFLGSNRAEPNPAHVTYVRDPSHDSARAQAVADHAYWVSDVVTRTAEPGTIDIRSEGFGVGDAPVLALRNGSGTLSGGSHGALLYTYERRDWGAVPAAPVADRLVIKATNVASATIDPRRARVSCGATLAVTTDGPFKLALAGCGPAGVKSFGG
jgi:dienelactone hydrolase